MSHDMWVTVGFVVVIGLPLAVIVGAIYWPERIPSERSVDGIRERIEADDRPRRHAIKRQPPWLGK